MTAHAATARRTRLLLSVIFLEGYAVLATELLAIRVTLPYVGGGTDTVSVIIAAVLMPLAFGYHRGGSFRGGGARRRVARNVLFSLLLLVPGLSYPTVDLFFTSLIRAGIDHRLLLTTLYCAAFLVTPVYLLGQTVPLVSNHFPRARLSSTAGRILLFSTLGSFLGAVFSTLVLMTVVGVHGTAAVTFFVLAALVPLLGGGGGGKARRAVPALALAALGALLNAPFVLARDHVVSNNRYNLVRAYTDARGFNQFSLNHMSSSKYRPEDDRKHIYIETLEAQLIESIPADAPPKDILVIGAGAFTFGLDDDINRYDYVDIDGSLKELAEEHTLGRPLLPNKTFIPVEARAFLRGAQKKWDIIVIDVFLGGVTIPEHLVTREFFQQLRDHLNEGGVVAANFMMSANFSNALSRNMDVTFRSVFPFVSRHAVMGNYGIWEESGTNNVNTLYFYRHRPGEEEAAIYTDNRNTMFLDKPQKY